MATIILQKSNVATVAYFRISPTSLRAGKRLLILAAFLVFVALPFLLARWFADWLAPLAVIGAHLIVMAGMVLLLAAMFFRWRVRIDHSGIAQRGLFWWKAWPWEAFASGRVDYGIDLHSYVCPSMPWWKRTLSIGALAEDDLAGVLSLINHYWKRPPVEAPEELKIRYRHGNSACFNRDGVVIGKRGREHWHPWSNVECLRITRLDHERRDFEMLELQLPDQTMKIARMHHRGDEIRTWSGADADVICAALIKFVLPERIVYLARSGPPRSMAECKLRIEQLDKRIRYQARSWWFFGVLPVGMFLLELTEGWFAAVGTLVFVLAWIGLLLLFGMCFGSRDLHGERAELEAWQNANRMTE